MTAACVNHPEVFEETSSCVRCANTFCLDCLVSVSGARVCAGCKASTLAGGRTVLAYAGFWPRAFAWFVDSLIIASVVYGVVGIFGSLPDYMATAGRVRSSMDLVLPIVSKPLTVIPSALLMTVYEGLLLQRYGKTLGKMLLKLEVTERDGSKLTARSAWLRAVSKTGFAQLGFLILADYVLAIFKREKTTGHDLIATTRVVSR